MERRLGQHSYMIMWTTLETMNVLPAELDVAMSSCCQKCSNVYHSPICEVGGYSCCSGMNGEKMENNHYKYIIEACYQHEFKFIYSNNKSVEDFLDHCELNWIESFLESLWTQYYSVVGTKSFQFEFVKAIVELENRDCAIIHKQRFANVIEQFSSCGYFYVRLKINEICDATFVTPQVRNITYKMYVTV